MRLLVMCVNGVEQPHPTVTEKAWILADEIPMCDAMIGTVKTDPGRSLGRAADS
jgi:hypothetical protein